MSNMNIEYLRRKNLGGYEHEELKVSIVVDEDDDINFEIESLKSLVHKHLGIIEEDKNQLPLPIQKSVKEADKAIEAPKKEEPIEDKVKEEVKEEPKAKKGRPKSETPKPPVSVSKPETVPVKKPVKETNYDRSLDVHKNLLGQFLDKAYPKWRVAENLKKASEASKALNGTPFLDAEGNILESFKAEFSKLMNE